MTRSVLSSVFRLFALALALALALAGSARAQGSGSRRFEVTAFGAIADGIHDDAAAIQKAFDAAESARGANDPMPRQTIVFPPGIYRTSAAIRVRFECDVCGDSALLVPDASYPVFDVRSDSVTLRSLRFDLRGATGATARAILVRSSPQNPSVSRIRIERILVDAAADATALQIREIDSDVVVSDCELRSDQEGTWGSGILVASDPAQPPAVGVVIEDNLVLGFVAAGIANSGTGILESLVVSGNRVRKCGTGIRGYHSHGLFTGNVIEECTEGWFLDGQAGPTVATGNVVQHNARYGVRFEEFEGTFSDNVVRSNGANSTPENVNCGDVLPLHGAGLVIGDARGAVFSGNKIEHNKTGVFIDQDATTTGCSGQPVFGVDLVGNSIVFSRRDGVLIQGAIHECVTVRDNDIHGNNTSNAPGLAGVRFLGTASGNGRLIIQGNTFTRHTTVPAYAGGTQLSIVGTGYPSGNPCWVAILNNVVEGNTIVWPSGPGVAMGNLFFGVTGAPSLGQLTPVGNHY